MTTITTKELRDNMAAVVRDLQNGKPVRITYRQKVIGTLQPAQIAKPQFERGSAQAVLDAHDQFKLTNIPKRLQDPNYNFKEQMADLRAAKYKRT